MVSVIIVAYENREDVEAVVGELLALESLVHEIIIVDHSESFSCEPLYHDPRIVYLRQVNRGFAAGVNRGAAHANAPFLWILNPDVILERPILDAMFHEVPSHTRWIATPLLRYPSGRMQADAYRMWWFSTERLLRRLIRRFSPIQLSERPGKIAGTAMLLPRAFFDELGGFDEAFFMYFEDADFSLRARKSGAVLVVCRSVTLVHKAGSSARRWPRSIESYRGHGVVYLARKHRGDAFAFFVFSEVAVVAALHLLLGFLSGSKSRDCLGRIAGGWRALAEAAK